MKEQKIIGNISLWVLIPTIAPIGFGVFVTSKLNWETQLQRLNKDPLGFILAGIVVYGVFFIMPIILSLSIKTVAIDKNELIIKYPIRRMVSKFYIDQIEKVRTRNGSSRGISFKEVEIKFYNGKKVTFNSKQITNFKQILSKIKERKTTMGNKV